MNEKKLKEAQRKEAIKKLKKLEKLFNLNPKVLEDFELGKINTSLFDKIVETQNIKNLDKIITDFEKENNALVYHCIGGYFNLVFLLFVNEEYPSPLYDLGDKKFAIFSYRTSLTKNCTYYNIMGLATLDSNKGVLTVKNWFCCKIKNYRFKVVYNFFE